MRCRFKKRRLETLVVSALSAAHPDSTDAGGLALEPSTQTWVPGTWVPGTTSAPYAGCLALGTLFSPSRLSFFTCRIERVNGCS